MPIWAKVIFIIMLGGWFYVAVLVMQAALQMFFWFGRVEVVQLNG